MLFTWQQFSLKFFKFLIDCLKNFPQSIWTDNVTSHSILFYKGHPHFCGIKTCAKMPEHIYAIFDPRFDPNERWQQNSLYSGWFQVTTPQL
jgi:hypothetical protein